MLLEYGGNIDWSASRYDDWNEIWERWKEDRNPDATAYDTDIQAMWRFRTEMRPGDIVVASDGYRHFRGVKPAQRRDIPIPPNSRLPRDQSQANACRGAHYNYNRSANSVRGRISGLRTPRVVYRSRRDRPADDREPDRQAEHPRERRLAGLRPNRTRQNRTAWRI